MMSRPSPLSTIVCTFLLIIIFSGSDLRAQDQTVGLFINEPSSSDGYTLFAPMGATTTYLIDNYGREVHSWPGTTTPEKSVYLLENGQLLRTTSRNLDFSIGGGVELVEWDGTVVWTFNYYGSDYRAHHDVAPLPNGNVLILVRETKTIQEAVQAGVDRTVMTLAYQNTEYIIEVEPTGDSTGNIVWEWHLWDHLVQEHDSTKDNYGVVADHPELLNINYGHVPGQGDWTHANGIDYNAELDQIVISFRNLHEIMIIDHSTTTAEAASHSGGLTGKGGDILYRWGNPEAYQAGTVADRKFFYQHNANWVNSGFPGEGNIVVFNNGGSRPEGDYSSADEIIPPLLPDGNYTLPSTGNAYLPFNQEWIYVASPPESFYSANISGVQRLSNGNTLICEGATGRFFEVTPDRNIVWEYINPMSSDESPDQGGLTDGGRSFRCYRYYSDYAGLQGKDLSPKGPLETYPIYIGGTTFDPVDPGYASPVTVTSMIYDDVAVSEANIWVNTGSGFVSIPMYDDGAHNDGLAGDSLFGGVIPALLDSGEVEFYISAEDDSSNLVIDPPSAPATTYRYSVSLSGISHLHLTLIEQQTNYPILTESDSPEPGNVWTWSITDAAGFDGSPVFWFEYLNAEQTEAEFRWSSISQSDWQSGASGTFTLTLSDGVSSDKVYAMSLTMRTLVADRYDLFQNQTSGGPMMSAAGVEGFTIEAFAYDGIIPAPFILFDDMGAVTQADADNWNQDGTVTLAIKDGSRPVAYVEGINLSLLHVTPDSMLIFNDGNPGSVVLQVNDGADLWDWSDYNSGMTTSILTAPDVSGSALFSVGWAADALLDGETADGSITINRSGTAAPTSTIAIPTVIMAVGCCDGLTGNVDNDPGDIVDIGDLTALIGYLFIPPFEEPACLDEANIDGTGTVDIGDLTGLIGYLFIPPFTAPAECP